MDEQLEEVYQASKSDSNQDEAASNSLLGSLWSDQYTLVATASEPAPIKGTALTNIQGWLGGASSAKTEESESTPTIAVVAYYDTFGIAPDLATGADSNGSGVVALLELARLFSKLYSGIRTQAKYNLLFVLTAGGRLNYAGTRQWLDQLDQRLLASIQFALCLDSLVLSPDQRLYLHISRPPKDPKIRHLFDSLRSVGTSLGVEVEVVHKKINVSVPLVAWEHELFSRKRIAAATISSQNNPSPALFSRTNILDNIGQVDIEAVERSIKLIAEGLGRYVYGLDNESYADVELFAGPTAIHTHFINSYLQTIASFPRVQPYIPTSSPLLTAMEKALSEYTEVTRVGSAWDGGVTFEVDEAGVKTRAGDLYVFYSPSVGSIQAHKVKPFTFDLLLFVVIAIYLAALYTYLKGWGEALKQAKSFFTKESKKRR